MPCLSGSHVAIAAVANMYGDCFWMQRGFMQANANSGENQHSLFHFDDDKQSFEDLASTNGDATWSGRQLMGLLGYTNWSSFEGVINKAVTACMSVKASTLDHFRRDGSDYRLTKFACYLVVMNADSRKTEVAKAQAYFAVVVEAFQKFISSAGDVERVEIRQELTDREKSLSSCASRHGVQNYAFFRDRGYLGMYNMTLAQLRKHKGDPSQGKRPLFDFMAKRELAANLFRITETEARIEDGGITGQRALEQTALEVGQSIRNTMMDKGGTAPENLQLTTDINKVRSDLKKTAKGLEKSKGNKLSGG
jgi:DNA-damage-inducible protein D